MKSVLITGSDGFIGRNLVVALRRQEGLNVLGYDLKNSPAELDAALSKADIVYHLAGINRPKNEAEFETGNAGFTETLCAKLQTLGRRPRIVFSSSIQAALDNPYGKSKRKAEEALVAFAGATGAAVAIYRLQNAFGKWCRPNYNSVVATFCHNLAHDLPLQISDPARELDLVYVDDIVQAFLAELALVQDEKHALVEEAGGNALSPARERADVSEANAGRGDRAERPGSIPEGGRAAPGSDVRTIDQASEEPLSLPSPAEGRGRAITPFSEACYRPPLPAFRISLGQLAELLRAFAESRRTLVMPDLTEPFSRKLYATFTSYLPEEGFAYPLQQRADPRGVLAEFIKSAGFGQIFVSRTFPGITRGNHYHHTKVEKFLVLEGEAVIRFRPIGSQDKRGQITFHTAETKSVPFYPLEYRVSGRDFKVVDIPPGYTHSIENVGLTEMIVLFWAGQIFDPAVPDTYAEEV